MGRELRLMVNNDLLRSQVFKGIKDLGWADLAGEWRQAFYAKGWEDWRGSESLGET
jgi:hypothetical protein